MTTLPRCVKCGRDIGYTRARGWHHIHNNHRQCNMETATPTKETPQ